MRVRLRLSASSGAVSAHTSVAAEQAGPSQLGTSRPTAAKLAGQPAVGTLLYGTPLLRKSSDLRCDYELGVIFERGNAIMGDGDISYILWLQRVVAGGSEVERFNETNERFPNSKVWALTDEIGQATLTGPSAPRIDHWGADDGAFFTREDAAKHSLRSEAALLRPDAELPRLGRPPAPSGEPLRSPAPTPAGWRGKRASGAAACVRRDTLCFS